MKAPNTGAWEASSRISEPTPTTMSTELIGSLGRLRWGSGGGDQQRIRLPVCIFHDPSRAVDCLPLCHPCSPLLGDGPAGSAARVVGGVDDLERGRDDAVERDADLCPVVLGLLGTAGMATDGAIRSEAAPPFSLLSRKKGAHLRRVPLGARVVGSTAVEDSRMVIMYATPAAAPAGSETSCSRMLRPGMEWAMASAPMAAAMGM